MVYMHATRVLGLVLAALCLAGNAVASASSSIAIVASDWKFTPNHITLKVGVAQDLSLSSSQGVHGLQSDELGIAQTLIMPGKTTVITVTPKKAGTYVLHCAIQCGAGHENMTLTVTVK